MAIVCGIIAPIFILEQFLKGTAFLRAINLQSLLKAGMALLCLNTFLLLSGCSSSEDEVQGSANSVTDEVSYEISGVDGDVLANVQASLSSIPAVSKKNSFLFTREMRDKSKTALRALGYYSPKITIEPPDPRGDSNVVKINIDEGKSVFIRECNIELLGEGARYQSFLEIIEKSGLKSYGHLNHGDYEALKSELKNHALSLGFFDYQVLVSQLVVYEDEGRVDIQIIADTGKRYNFGDLIADDKTRELLKPAAALMTLDKGTPFSAEALKKFQQDMSRTGYYSSIDARAQVENKHDYEVPLELHLERKSKNLMRVGLGVSTDEGARVLLAWDKPLLNEKGHSLSTYARVSAVKQNAEIVYKIPRKDPNLDYYYIRAAQIHTDLNDTKSDLSHLSLHYVADKTGKWHRDYSLRGEYEDYTQGRERGNSFNVMPGLLLSRRESSGGFDPQRGYAISGDFTGGTQLWSDYNFFRSILSLQGIMSPSENTRFLFRMTGGAIFGSDATRVPPSLRFFAGGDRSVRGFDYMRKAPKKDGYLKGGRYMATGTAEFQFPIGISSSRGALFLDAGKVFDRSGSDNEKMLWGPGIGYRFLSKYGTAAIDLATGISGDEHSYRLHFSFGPEF